MYEISGLTFAYTAAPVLRDVSFRIGEGEFVAIVGPNGAGKSTLLKLMAGLLDPGSGSLRYRGRAIGDYPPRELARTLAFVAQETHVAFPFSVDEMVLMGRLPHRSGFLFDTASDEAVAAEAMSLTGTGALAGKLFNEISGGERQRVVLASALAQKPGVLLLDEPTVYLDLKHQVHFYRILERLNRLEGMTIVTVTHDVNLASRYARRMLAIRDGAILADGSPAEIVTAANLNAIFEITADIVRGPGGEPYVIPSA